MTDESELEDFMPCHHPDCGNEATHSLAVWPSPGHLQVDYYCPEHAPEGAETFDEQDEETE
jgi:hypothetical protein